MLAACHGLALAQQAAPPAAPPPPKENPGLLNEIGKIIDKSGALLPSLNPLRAADPDSAPPAQDAPPAPAAPSIPSPPPAAVPAAPPAPPPTAPAPAPGDGGKLVPTVATGRLRCDAGPGGAPDCEAAAARLCAGKGYKAGHSLSTDSAEDCSAKMLIPGRGKRPEDCRINSYVTRALCQ